MPTFTQQYRNCGKCSRCKGTNAKVHGPYVYSAYWKDGKLKTGYTRLQEVPVQSVSLPPTHFGACMRTRRKALGMTIACLAESVGYSSGYLHKIEAGRCLPTRGIIQALASALQVEREQLQALAMEEG